MNRFLRRAVAAAALSATGCGFHLGDSTAGQEGAVAFEYSGWSCLFGCSMKQPLLVGTEQAISVSGARADEAGVVAKSTAPGVATFTVDRSCDCEQSSGNSTTYMSADANDSCEKGFSLACQNLIKVHAVSAGSADLELRDGGGSLIDRTAVRVAAASSATLHDADGNEIGASLSMRRGEGMVISTRLVDAAGTELLADQGVSWTIDGTSVSSGWCLLCTSDETEITADRTGDSTVTMSAAGATAAFTVHVTP